MSIFGDMTDALIMEDEALAPFMSYCEGTEELFKRMEVIDEKSELSQSPHIMVESMRRAVIIELIIVAVFILSVSYIFFTLQRCF